MFVFEYAYAFETPSGILLAQEFALLPIHFANPRGLGTPKPSWKTPFPEKN